MIIKDNVPLKKTRYNANISRISDNSNMKLIWMLEIISSPTLKGRFIIPSYALDDISEDNNNPNYLNLKPNSRYGKGICMLPKKDTINGGLITEQNVEKLSEELKEKYPHSSEDRLKQLALADLIEANYRNKLSYRIKNLFKKETEWKLGLEETEGNLESLQIGEKIKDYLAASAKPEQDKKFPYYGNNPMAQQFSEEYVLDLLNEGKDFAYIDNITRYLPQVFGDISKDECMQMINNSITYEDIKYLTEFFENYRIDDKDNKTLKKYCLSGITADKIKELENLEETACWDCHFNSYGDAFVTVKAYPMTREFIKEILTHGWNVNDFVALANVKTPAHDYNSTNIMVPILRFDQICAIFELMSDENGNLPNGIIRDAQRLADMRNEPNSNIRAGSWAPRIRVESNDIFKLLIAKIPAEKAIPQILKTMDSRYGKVYSGTLESQVQKLVHWSDNHYINGDLIKNAEERCYYYCKKCEAYNYTYHNYSQIDKTKPRDT